MWTRLCGASLKRSSASRRSFDSNVDVFVQIEMNVVGKRVKESRNVKKVEKVIFLKKKHFCLQVFLGGSTGNRSSVSSFFWNVVLHPFCSHGASTRTFVETTNIWFVVFVWFPLTLRFYTMTALPVNPSTRWTCTAHPAATISCCNSWNADFFLFVKYKVSELL